MLKDLKEKLNIRENYVSMGLGLVVVLIVGNLIFNALTGKNKESALSNGSSSTEKSEATKSAKKEKSFPAKYTVKEGEDLWAISKKFYGSGYNWSDIVKANKLANPDRVEVGTQLTIPDVSPRPAPTGAQAEIYTVRAGETLFDIAVKVYGDGFAYTKIVKANNLRDPNQIEKGQKLVIPR